MSTQSDGSGRTDRRSSLFRQEALDYHASSRSAGELLRLPPAWMRSAYPLALVMIAAALAFGWFGSARRYVEATAARSGPTLTLLMPADVTGRLEIGAVLRVVIREGGSVAEAVVESVRGPLPAAEARLALGPGAVAWLPDEPALAVTARIDASLPAPSGAVATADVGLPAERLLTLLLERARRDG